jgi:predicted transcriptional regulator
VDYSTWGDLDSAIGKIPLQGSLLRRSKLIIYLDILKVLRRNGPMNPTGVMCEVNACFMYIEQYLDFLIKHQLVEKKVLRKGRAIYTITEKGMALVRTYEELEKVLPIADGEKVEKDLLENAKDSANSKNTKKTPSARVRLSAILSRLQSS